ncbi:MAG: replication-associated recombination protein A [Clostridia bacterium]|nr:replication-associated recombination protein A [Clostridia bacterium]
MGYKTPLAVSIRPDNIDMVAGQKHILGEGKILRNILNSGIIPNMIFYGPSGTGKTTVANIAATVSNRKLYKLNATTASVSDIKQIISELDGFDAMQGVILYLDEIQNFNKKQQQSLLEVIENGSITLIASTTENPYFYIYNAILSRCSVFEFKPVEPAEMEGVIKRAVLYLSKEYAKKISICEKAILHISHMSNGDVRKALNAVEVSFLNHVNTKDSEVEISLDDAVQATQRSSLKYDRDGDNHYDIISAFQKSIRGSDPDAAVHYLARLVLAGDIQIICRRLMVIAAEDIGLAYPMAVPIVKGCVDSALMLGFPEARIPLAEATVLLATAPKSNSAYMALAGAIEDIENINTGEIPRQLQNKHYDGEGDVIKGQHYLYPHDYPNHYVEQQYLPDKIKNKQYYRYGENKNEQAFKTYWEQIKKK